MNVKRWFCMARIRTNDPECCYDTFTVEYSGHAYRSKWEAEAEVKRALKDARVVNAWSEERMVLYV